jgi:hypothetical protein
MAIMATDKYLVKLWVSASRSYTITIASKETTLKGLMTHPMVSNEIQRKGKEVRKVEFFNVAATHTWERDDEL